MPNCCPTLLKGSKSGQVRCAEECFRRASKPALQPDPFRAEDVGERVAYRPKAMAHVASEHLVREWCYRGKHALVGPVVVVVQFANRIKLHKRSFSCSLRATTPSSI